MGLLLKIKRDLPCYDAMYRVTVCIHWRQPSQDPGYFVWRKLRSPFLLFSNKQALAERGRMKKMNHSPSLLLENVTSDGHISVNIQHRSLGSRD